MKLLINRHLTIREYMERTYGAPKDEVGDERAIEYAKYVNEPYWKLVALGDAPSADDVEKMFLEVRPREGYSRTRFQCTACHEYVRVAVEVVEYDGECGAEICVPCLRSAITLVEGVVDGDTRAK